MGWLKRLLGKPDRGASEAQVAKGAICARQRNLDAALVHYGNAVRLDEHYPLAQLNLALVHQDLFNRDRDKLSADEKHERLLFIVEQLEKTLELDEDNVFAWRSIGVAAMSLKAPIRAEEAFAKVLDLCDESFPHVDEVRRYFSRMTKEADRERLIQVVITLSSDDEEADKEEILAALEAVADELDAGADVMPRNDLFFSAAKLYKSVDEQTRARLFFERVLETMPHHPRALREAATLCLLLDDVDDALQHSIVAYRDDPTDAGVTCNVGVCYLQLGNLEKADEFISLALDLDPKDAIITAAKATLRSQMSAQE